MSKSRFKPVTLAAVLTGLCPVILSSPVYATTMQKGVTAVLGKDITRREEDIISTAGVKVLRHIAQARSDIHAKDTEGANTELDQTGKLLDIIQEALPTTKVKDLIWVAKKHLEYEDPQEVLPDLVPIFTSLDELIGVMPVDVPKKHLEQAREHLKSGDKEKASEALDATDTALQYIEIDLPLSTTRQLVAQARNSLDKGRPDDADMALKSAEDSVVYLSLAIEQPLFSAKSLLWQTVLDVEAGHNDQAKADLQGAIGYLETAGQSDERPTREAAEQLLEQARQMQEDLNNGGDVGVKIHHLWQRAQAFADRSVEYVAAGWARYRAENVLKADLIEARLHLANARIDLFTGHETSQARQELDTSLRYLEKAAAKTQQGNGEQIHAKRIDAIRSAIKDLGTDHSTAKQAGYLAVEHQVSDMIHSLSARGEARWLDAPDEYNKYGVAEEIRAVNAYNKGGIDAEIRTLESPSGPPERNCQVVAEKVRESLKNPNAGPSGIAVPCNRLGLEFAAAVRCKSGRLQVKCQ